MRTFCQVDVFSSGALTGNPLAVVLDADDLTHDQMHDFARWTNLSETTFLVSPTDARADYCARIYTPRGEIPFAGHPTLGSCHVWMNERAPATVGDRIVQQCGAGLIDLRITPAGLAFSAPPLMRDGPLGSELKRQIALSLRIDVEEIIGDHWADNGAGWAAVMLRDAEAVLSLNPGTVDLDVGVVGPYAPGGPADYEVRAFYPKNGSTAEDPVTGSLNAGIGQWLLGAGLATAPYRVRQGTAIGHDGRVTITQENDGTVWIAGSTATIVKGVVAL